jgi:uncharacterized protein YjbI with pentapeptide repeats
MTRRIRLIIAGGAVLAVAVAGISWFAFASGNDMGEGATSAKSLDEAKVPVSVVLSADARRLSVNIDWHDELDALRGDDRFTARVMAGSEEIVLKQWEDTRPDVDSFTLEFTEVEATLLLAAVESGDAVVAVTQQSDTDLDSDSLYEANFATVLTIQAPTEAALPADVAATAVIQLASMQMPTVEAESALARDYPDHRDYRDCSDVRIAPNVDLSGCRLYGAVLVYTDLSGANLSGAYLSGANLFKSNLYGANLSGAYLRGANLYKVNLSGANLSGATTSFTDMQYVDLTFADVRDANLRDANLFGADLSGADLSHADLTYAKLYKANLRSADLTSANLSFANLYTADLSDANLSDANLYGADLSGATCSSGQKATGTPPAC